MLRSKTWMHKLLLASSFACTLLGATLAHAAPWEFCGTLQNIDPLTCQIVDRPLTVFEYGIAYNTIEPVPVVCTTWNLGVRIANKTPYFIESDNPLVGMRYGGFVFYQNTAAEDDEACAGGYRHQYWRLTTNNVLEVLASNGCYFDLPIYCRLH